MFKYPKIYTLYKRNQVTYRIDTLKLHNQENNLIRYWLVTEKLDGMNIRICIFPDGHVEYHGRTNNANLPASLLKHLMEIFPAEHLCEMLKLERSSDVYPETILFGESYGRKIQPFGGHYDTVHFRLFDVNIGGWWLNWDAMEKFAGRLKIKTVPVLDIKSPSLPQTLDDLLLFFYRKDGSYGSSAALEDLGENDIEPEGIVARAEPLLFNRRGQRVMWKFKVRDFK